MSLTSESQIFFGTTIVKEVVINLSSKDCYELCQLITVVRTPKNDAFKSSNGSIIINNNCVTDKKYSQNHNVLWNSFKYYLNFICFYEINDTRGQDLLVWEVIIVWWVNE